MISIIESNIIQIDGRQSVVERHTDDTGYEQTVCYIADASADVQAELAVHAQQIVDMLAAQYAVTNEDGSTTGV